VDRANKRLAGDEGMRNGCKGLKKTFNIDLGAEKYSFRLQDSAISDFKAEVLPESDVTLTSTPETLQKLLDGDLRPVRAYITKKISVKGKIQDLMFLKKFF